MANESTHTIKPLLAQYPPPGAPGKSVSSIPKSAAAISPFASSKVRLPQLGCRRQKADAAFTFPSEHLPKFLPPARMAVRTLLGCAGSCVGVCREGTLGVCWELCWGFGMFGTFCLFGWHKLPFIQALLLLNPAQRVAPAALATSLGILDTEHCMINKTTVLGREWEQICSLPDRALLSLVIKRRDFSLALYC